MVALKNRIKDLWYSTETKEKVRKIGSSGWLMILRTMTEVKSVSLVDSEQREKDIARQRR